MADQVSAGDRERIERLRLALIGRAYDGCEGQHDCCEGCKPESPDNPEDWCDPCRSQEAALLLDLLASQAAIRAQQDETAHDDQARVVCINCAHVFAGADVRGWYGAPGVSRNGEVGPFCERCYATIKTHEEPRETGVVSATAPEKNEQ